MNAAKHGTHDFASEVRKPNRGDVDPIQDNLSFRRVDEPFKRKLK